MWRMWPRGCGGCGQGDKGRDGVVYYSEAINGNACSVCLFRLWERDFFKTQCYCILCVIIAFSTKKLVLYRQTRKQGS